MKRLFDHTRRVLGNLLGAPENEALRQQFEALRKVEAFSSLSDRALRGLTEVVHSRTFRRDEFLYYEQDPGLGIYIIQRGRVRLLAQDADREAVELGQAGQGMILGLPSLFGDYRRLESAQAVSEVEVLGFFRPDLTRLVKRRPRTGALVVSALAAQLASEYRALKVAAGASARQRPGILVAQDITVERRDRA
jgi:CRP/FNR family transcriptional regulator, cyclic AMP receptor protein